MLDKSIPYHRILMEKRDSDVFPHAPMPDGYSLRFWQPGDERIWSAIHLGVDHVERFEAGLAIFEREFMPRPEDARRRCLFAFDREGTPAGTASLWDGDYFGQTLPRLHWVAVAAGHQGKGLCKAMLAYLMRLYRELDLSGAIFLSSQTWSYKAINIYRQFGFEPCMRPPAHAAPDPAFEAKARLAWAIIDEKLAAYRAR